MSLPQAAEDALLAFSAPASWEQRARLLLQWGERLAPLSEDERCEANRVQGCESNVWLIADQVDGRWRFRLTSDARLMRGLLAVLLARIDGLAGPQLEHIDLADWFNQLGLARQLSPSRSNGLNAVLERIRALS